VRAGPALSIRFVRPLDLYSWGKGVTPARYPLQSCFSFPQMVETVFIHDTSEKVGAESFPYLDDPPLSQQTMSHEELIAENIIAFPLPHRGDPEPRRMVLSDADIDVMDVRTWEQSLQRWKKRRPQPRQ
jgi:hypothetical protein